MWYIYDIYIYICMIDIYIYIIYIWDLYMLMTVYGKLLERDLGIHTTDLRDIDTSHVGAMPRAWIACGAGVGGSSTAIAGALCLGRRARTVASATRFWNKGQRSRLGRSGAQCKPCWGERLQVEGVGHGGVGGAGWRRGAQSIQTSVNSLGEALKRGRWQTSP